MKAFTFSVLCWLAAGRSWAEPPRVLDAMNDAASWRVITSEGVAASVRNEDGGLRVDYEFTTGAGYAIVQKAIAVDVPAGNYAFEFRVRGEGLENNLEFKLLNTRGDAKADAEKSDVWWVNRRGFAWPEEWTTLKNRKRQIEFAWGPCGGCPLTHADKIEFAISSAKGGKGTVWLAGLEFRAFPPADGGGTTEASTIGSRWGWTSDYHEVREIGGIEFEVKGRSSARVSTSEDGVTWSKERPAFMLAGGKAIAFTPDTDARLVRVNRDLGGGVAEPADGADSAGSGTLTEVGVLGASASANETEMLKVVARAEPEGYWPRPLRGTQCFWTVVGLPESSEEVLVSEHGLVELAAKGYSIEPVVKVEGELETWARTTHAQWLSGGYRPIPTVVRKSEGLELRETTWATGTVEKPEWVVLMELVNVGSKERAGRLGLMLRPVQVNPPSQWLNIQGGAAEPAVVEGDSSGWTVRPLRGAPRRVVLEPAPERGGVADLTQGSPAGWLASGAFPETRQAGPENFACGAAEWAFDLKPGERAAWTARITGDLEATTGMREAEARADLAQREKEWEAIQTAVRFDVPAGAQDLIDTMRAQIGYIVVNADGPAIHPGSRSYERSWIRDGSLTSNALFQMGQGGRAVRFLDWYAEHIFPSGKAPCVVDGRGPDPVPENDSHGEYLWAVANAYRFTGDVEIVRRHWERVQRVAGYVEGLIAQRSTAEFLDASARRQEPGKAAVPVRAFAGLVPESISHEGYSSKPMHSYWDDFWTLRGLKDAVFLAGVMKDPKEASYAALRDRFAASLTASIELATATHGIDYVPGCVELGDFDATSTTIALWPVEAGSVLPPEKVINTFNRYWTEMSARSAGTRAWDAFTPYELRTVGSFVRLGEPARAWEMLEFFMSTRRPVGWKQWPEVVYHDPTAAKFLGDLPHTWVGSDGVNSILSMFAYDRERDGALVVFSGVPAVWAAEKPVRVQGLRTHCGAMEASMAIEGTTVTISVKTERVPVGGFVVRDPLAPMRVRSATANGAAVRPMGPWVTAGGVGGAAGGGSATIVLTH